MSQVTTNLMMVRQRLELAALAAKREPEDIQLLAVSKTFICNYLDFQIQI